MKPLSCCAFLCIALLRKGKAQSQEQCTYDQPIALDDDELVTMEQISDPVAGTYTMRLSYFGGQSWIGIGINLDGEPNMAPATAVIGRILDDGITPSVLKYNLISDAEDASGVLPVDDDFQTLTDARFTQTDTQSVLEFTQRLTDFDLQVTEDSMWIWAVGLPGNQWIGVHELHGAFKIILSDSCDGAPSSPVVSPAAAPAAAFVTTESSAPTIVSETSFPSTLPAESGATQPPTEAGATTPPSVPTSSDAGALTPTSAAANTSALHATIILILVAGAILR